MLFSWFFLFFFVPLQALMATKRLKHQYLKTLGIIVLVLALVRCIFPSLGRHQETASVDQEDSISVAGDWKRFVFSTPRMTETVEKTDTTAQTPPPDKQ